jgi:hypothetical protein
MRTTIDIENDVLAAAKALAAKQRGLSVGAIISTWARAGLRPAAVPPATRNGIPLLPLRADATPVTPELVNQLRDELP